MNKIKDNHGSGESDVDDLSKALRVYCMIYGHDFTLGECWKILRNHDAWKNLEMPAFRAKSRSERRVGRNPRLWKPPQDQQKVL